MGRKSRPPMAAESLASFIWSLPRISTSSGRSIGWPVALAPSVITYASDFMLLFTGVFRNAATSSMVLVPGV